MQRFDNVLSPCDFMSQHKLRMKGNRDRLVAMNNSKFFGLIHDFKLRKKFLGYHPAVRLNSAVLDCLERK